MKKVAIYSMIEQGKIELNGYNVVCEEALECPEFAQFDIVILAGGLFSLTSDYEKEEEAVRRERETFVMLEEGKTVCVLVYLPSDLLLRKIFDRTNILPIPSIITRTDIRVGRSEFTAFVRNYGAASFAFEVDSDNVIATIDGIATRSRISGHPFTEHSEGFREYYIQNLSVGFSKKIGKGYLILLPYHFEVKRWGDMGYLKEMTSCLLESIDSHLSASRFEPPDWIKDYRLPGEKKIIDSIDTLQRQLSGLQTNLQEYQVIKGILFLKGNELDAAVRTFFGRFSIDTKKDEIYEEDFWIVEDDKETIIVEVKGKDKNLDRPDISKLDEHRAARNKPDDFPALLVVNSFNRATSLKEKNIDISPNEIKKAMQVNVLIARTLDLFNAYALFEMGKITPVDLLKTIKSEKGWLKVDGVSYQIKRV